MHAEKPTSLDVLVVEDSEDDATLLKQQLEGAGYRINLERVDTGPALITALGRQHWDIVFSDFTMPRFDGRQALSIVRAHDRDMPFIIVSGTIGEERAVQMMKLGAQDYVIKGNVRRLVPAIEREIQEARVRREHRLAQEHIRHLAYHDPLTRLPNRHRLVEDLPQSLGQSGVALLTINLINFHEINGALGYRNGDQLIREAATRLQEVRINRGTLYHLHGNEFAILLPTDDHGHVELVVKSALKALGSHFLSAGVRIHIGARVGIAAFPQNHDIDAHTLLQQADLASRLAKHEGKACAWYDPQRDPSSPDRLALLADLHDALETDQLVLVFQPKVQCSSGVVTGSEALLRWNHPTHGRIGPEAFIGMAERSGIIDDLTRHVLSRAVEQMRLWQKRGKALPVAINLSVKNLLNDQLVAEIIQSAMHGGDENRIEIEITETALMRDPEQALAALRQLYKTGIRIYIDDFGTGFSSLGYLKRLPIHAIKIDKSFVLDLIPNPDSETIVRSTIGLAHNLGLEVVAEGVANREIWERLKTLECDAGQGYYFTKPLAPKEFELQFLSR